MRQHEILASLALALALAAPACSRDRGAGAPPAGNGPAAGEPGVPSAPGIPAPSDPVAPAPSDDPGVRVETTLSPEQQGELAAIQAQLDAVKGLDAAGLAAKYAVPFVTDLGYAPLSAAGLDLVQASPLALTANEQTMLAARGFVTTERKRWPSFAHGYEAIYTNDLPVYVSADSILYAVHHSYEAMLKQLEAASLHPALGRLLDSMRGGLADGRASDLSAEARRDVDVYLSVARSLLSGGFTPPVAGGDPDTARALFEGATKGAGMQRVMLFGVWRNVDLSQFVPRGHYTETPTLERYFRASMWLGRIDLRLLETQPDHTQVFRRRQLEGAYVIRALIDDAALADWRHIDSTIGAFVGEHDNMILPELDALLADLGLTTAAELSKRSDAELAQAIVSGGYGTQRISSHIMINGLREGTMPLSSTFLLLGQRYVLDSHVFSNVVYDRVNKGAPRRMMPNPLDVAFAALHNDQAGLLLRPDLERYAYAPELASMRVLADSHPQAFWEANLYNGWLGMLRALSPTADVAAPAAVGLPRVTATEAWGRRIASTQLASWTELRHDTILYAKQSYSGMPSCEYPDAYVEPYPELFARLAAYAARGAAIAGEIGSDAPYLAQSIAHHFAQVQTVASTLEAMTKNQRAGAPHTAEQMTFINKMLFANGCGVLSFDGWYAQLFWERDSATKLDALVADVHTQPGDEGGAVVGKILHVGTGMPRMMVVTVDGCSGPRAYVGVASGYFERITENFERLTDEQWQADLLGATPPEVPWMADLVAR